MMNLTHIILYVGTALLAAFFAYLIGDFAVKSVLFGKSQRRIKWLCLTIGTILGALYDLIVLRLFI